MSEFFLSVREQLLVCETEETEVSIPEEEPSSGLRRVFLLREMLAAELRWMAEQEKPLPLVAEECGERDDKPADFPQGVQDTAEKPVLNLSNRAVLEGALTDGTRKINLHSDGKYSFSGYFRIAVDTILGKLLSHEEQRDKAALLSDDRYQFCTFFFFLDRNDQLVISRDGIEPFSGMQTQEIPEDLLKREAELLILATVHERNIESRWQRQLSRGIEKVRRGMEETIESFRGEIIAPAVIQFRVFSKKMALQFADLLTKELPF